MKIVHYKGSALNSVYTGHPAFVQPIDHESDLVSNKTFVQTSTVKGISKYGYFKTENTLYVPEVTGTASLRDLFFDLKHTNNPVTKSIIRALIIKHLEQR